MSTLKEVDFRNNKNGDEAAEYIAAALSNNSTSLKLYLGNNSFGTAGINAIVKGLQNILTDKI